MRKFSRTLGTSLVACCAAAIVPTSAFAAAQPGDDMAWVAQDVTKATGYTLDYVTVSSSGQIISDKTVTPPPGSLVAFRQIPVSQAIAQGLDYIIPSGSTPLQEQLDALHQKVLAELNPNGSNATTTTSSSSTSDNLIQPNATTYINGQFAAYNATIDWRVYYSDGSGGSVQVTGYRSWQPDGTGTTWQDLIKWDGSQYTWPTANNANLIPKSSDGSSFLPWNGAWNGTSGQVFTTDVTGNDFQGTMYSGFATIN